MLIMGHILSTILFTPYCSLYNFHLFCLTVDNTHTHTGWPLFPDVWLKDGMVVVVVEVEVGGAVVGAARLCSSSLTPETCFPTDSKPSIKMKDKPIKAGFRGRMCRFCSVKSTSVGSSLTSGPSGWASIISTSHLSHAHSCFLRLL